MPRTSSPARLPDGYPTPDERIGLWFSTLSGYNIVAADHPKRHFTFVREDVVEARFGAGCPDGEVCKTCPCRDEDDVCFPGERLRAELAASEARERVLCEALETYADEANWHERDVDHCDADGEVIGTERVPVAVHPGIARAALSASPVTGIAAPFEKAAPAALRERLTSDEAVRAAAWVLADRSGLDADDPEAVWQDEWTSDARAALAAVADFLCREES